jgi:hypothetical protein
VFFGELHELFGRFTGEIARKLVLLAGHRVGEDEDDLLVGLFASGPIQLNRIRFALKKLFKVEIKGVF